LPFPIKLKCKAAACQSKEFPTHSYKKLAIITAIFGGTLILFIIGGILFYMRISRNRRRYYEEICTRLDNRFEDYKNNDNLATVKFSGISLTIKNKEVLDHISGVALPGQITAIMGPSGKKSLQFLSLNVNSS
jgi:ABC-type transport system involved in cytochrome bd biosynthesis fused ATPase/permease subunit